MRNSIVKFVMAALIAISATYAGVSSGQAGGGMNGSGGMMGMGDGSGGGGQHPLPPPTKPK